MASVATDYTGKRRLGGNAQRADLRAAFGPAQIPAFDRPLGNFNVENAIHVSSSAVTSAQRNLQTLAGLEGQQGLRTRFDVTPPAPSRQFMARAIGLGAGMALSAINPFAGYVLEAVNFVQDTNRFSSSRRAMPHSDGVEEIAAGTVRDRNTSQLQHHLNALLLLRAVQSRSPVTYDAPPDQRFVPVLNFAI
ncbi:MAG: hypothetical protein GC136_08300 [Alphaproteobacteria bacterium]|nr:hypothetical protein [Alphaproteobacteria bacterium]